MITQTAMTKNGARFASARRINQSITAGVEKRILVWMAERAPAWLTSDQLTVLGLGAQIGAYSAVTREFVFRYRSAEALVDTFRTYYGPTNRAFAALEPEDQDALEHDLLTLSQRWNRSTTGSLAVPSEYLEIVASTH